MHVKCRMAMFGNDAIYTIMNSTKVQNPRRNS